MIKINNHTIDLALQIEDSVSISKLLNKLTLETDTILLITTEVFFSRLMIYLYEENCVNETTLHNVEDDLTADKSTVELNITYKGKEFLFYIIIWKSESKTVDTPFKGSQTYKLGFREIKL